ncbi:MAG: preprotein translocase subunit SecE [Clostridia bacterium]|nr:preprotein translocase subunit SecE [Clostridia bacterium]MCR5693695.1 preprotein translocase subunit SecE [Clostridia bacterium]
MANDNEKNKKGFKAFMSKIGHAISGFFSKIFDQLKKVTWPTKKELLKSTISVLVVCFFIGALIFGIDSILRFILDFLVRPKV